MSAIEHDAELDARGLFCPEPVMMLHNRINDVQPGGVLRVVATDPPPPGISPVSASFWATSWSIKANPTICSST